MMTTMTATPLESFRGNNGNDDANEHNHQNEAALGLNNKNVVTIDETAPDDGNGDALPITVDTVDKEAESTEEVAREMEMRYGPRTAQHNL
jgi:hypothetical protein